jgi:hypothetical protein
MDDTMVTKQEMLRRIQDGWDELQRYLKTLTPEQLTQPKDAAGWTVKDHIMHLAVWEGGIVAVLKGESRQAHMGVDDATWKMDWRADDFFRINDVIFQQHKNKSLDAALSALQTAHEGMMAAVGGLSDADLTRPYNYFDASSTSERPVWDYIAGDSYDHYGTHRPWIAAIAAGT